MKKITHYRSSQQDLYGIGRAAWKSCMQQMADFNLFSKYYSKETVADRLAEIDAAEKIPSLQGRGYAIEVGRIQLIQLADDCLSKWRILKRYITKAFPKGEISASFDASGQRLYSKASVYNWESIRFLLSDASVFMANNRDILTAKENMPETFPDLYESRKKAFIDGLETFQRFKGNNPLEVDAKLTANNAVYDQLSSMMMDGQEIYTRNNVLRSLFVFDTVWSVISGTTAAGFRGIVTNVVTGASITTALIATADDYSAAVDEKGRYYLTGLAAGTVTLTVSAKGYHSKQIPEAAIKAGTVSTLNVTLEPDTA